MVDLFVTEQQANAHTQLQQLRQQQMATNAKFFSKSPVRRWSFQLY